MTIPECRRTAGLCGMARRLVLHGRSVPVMKIGEKMAAEEEILCILKTNYADQTFPSLLSLSL